MDELIADLRERGEGAINRWIAEQRSESLYLDCKLKENSATSSLDKNDKRNLVRSVSAFANSEGGILIWGINARKQGEVDAMVEKRPIANLRAFRSQVEQTLAETIAPPIPGLDYIEILAEGSSQAGFLAVIVPLSDRRPHMSSHSAASGYYFRNGHQSCLMAASQVRDQMMRQKVPKLDLEWEARIPTQQISASNRGSRTIPLSIDLILRNDSLVSARFPYLLVRVDRGIYLNLGAEYGSYASQGIPVNRLGRIEGFPRHPQAGSMSVDTEFSGGADCVIHPKSSLRVAELKVACAISVSQDYRFSSQPTSLHYTPKAEPFLKIFVELFYGCLDAAIECSSLRLDGSDIYANLVKMGQAGPFVVPV